MPLESEKILPVFIEEEMKTSYIDYSMSVITNRALPDVRDGLKPSNRRIMVAMNDLGLAPNRQHRKCAKICGDTSGNYHPHGEQVVYPTLVRMAQEFNMRYILVDGQGNFGSIDGDAAAAMRYTEARLTPVAMEMLLDLEKNTVGMRPNYDETREEPTVLPSKFPNLICNGATGIAVGMATNIPTHNLAEVVDALVALIDEPESTVEDMMQYIKGPDFPTGGLVFGISGMRQGYLTGRGRFFIRAKANIEVQKNGREHIIVSEIPYQINKSNLLERIAELVRDKKIEGISDLRDESDRDGMRIVIELKKDAQADIVLNQLFKMTQMQSTFGMIMLALVNGEPRVLNLAELLQHFIDHRHEVVLRRTRFELDEAERRAHILEGYKIALDNLDAVIKLIRASKDPAEAKDGLMKRFMLSEIQAQAILDLRLQRLTGMEREKIIEEYEATIKLIAELNEILASRARRMRIIKDELKEMKSKYGDDRRTQIIEEEINEDFSIEDLIAEEDMIVTITHSGYIKRLSTSSYRRQGRGTKGVIGMETKDEDFAEHVFVASTHNYILFFTRRGRCHWLKVHEIPQGGRLAKGKAIVNLIGIDKDDSVSAFVPVRNFDTDEFIILATKQGQIKKTEIRSFANPRRDGIIAMTLPKDDELIEAGMCDGTADIVLATRKGMAVRFPETKVRDMGRAAYGVRGIDLKAGDYVVGMVVIRRESSLLTVSENGFGKRSEIADYRVTNRGGKGVINIRMSERNGEVVAIMEVVDGDELLLITQRGIVNRLAISSIRTIGRATQGVRLMSLGAEDKVIDVARVPATEKVTNGLPPETPMADDSPTREEPLVEEGQETGEEGE
ncbi:MAG: DNA gyrase subunit A [candidate division Zixibacteria bacterium RBG_16_53_22]|nr:MAG: DNA gyrase subunit A [candidate division Zixibacteria bacterium RBG_16_53_22]